MSPMPQRSIVERMFGAAMLSAPTYEEVENDRGATGQAFVVVVLGAVAHAIGMGMGRGLLAALIVGVVSAVLSWLAWSSVALLVGTRLFGGSADYGQMLRALGFAQTPMILVGLAVIPFLGALVVPLAYVWMLVASLVAIRQALDLDMGKAILTALVGIGVMLLIKFVSHAIFGIASLGAFALR